MQNIIVIWKKSDSDRSDLDSLKRRLVIVFPQDQENEKLLSGVSKIENNMGLDELRPDERLPIKISKDKKGIIIADKFFYYFFYGSKELLEHKERVMNQVLKKCSNLMKNEAKNGEFNKGKKGVVYSEVETIYKNVFEKNVLNRINSQLETANKKASMIYAKNLDHLENLEGLDQETKQMIEEAKAFNQNSKDVHQAAWLLNKKLALLIFGSLTLVVLLIVLFVYRIFFG